MDERQDRWGRVRAEMTGRAVDYLLVGPSSDLTYLTGLHLNPSERLVLLVIPQEGRAALILPRFLISRMAAEGLDAWLELLPWGETEDPVERLAARLRQSGPTQTLGINNHLYAGFLLRIQAALPEARFVEGSAVTAPVRMVKSPGEIARLRAVAKATDAAFQNLIATPLQGMTEREILSRFQHLALEHGADRAHRGVVALGEHGSSPYHAMADRRARPGDALLIDIGTQRAGYHFELTRTAHLGPPTEEFQRIYEGVREANQRAFERVAPGASASSVDAAARDHLAALGLADCFSHRTGHGIGLDAHEPPYIVADNALTLQPGMTFSIEPGVYLQGKFGVRIEDIVLVNPTGAERLTRTPHELPVLPVDSSI